jgi:hypothetical protein
MKVKSSPDVSAAQNGGGHPTTTHPLSEAAARASRPDAEFVDARGLAAGWGIKRSLAYALLAEGAIEGVSLRRRGQLRGKRLFKVDSVRAFLARCKSYERGGENE